MEAKYQLKKGNILKDGHTMFLEDVVKDLQRKSYLETKLSDSYASQHLAVSEQGLPTDDLIKRRDRDLFFYSEYLNVVFHERGPQTHPELKLCLQAWKEKFLNKRDEEWILSRLRAKPEDEGFLKEVQEEEERFLKAVQEERDKFVKKINSKEWDTDLRCNAENILIMYDQMAEKLKTP